MSPAAEDSFVFNVVWTGTVFSSLRYFAASQLDHSRARFRFVGNGCPPDQLEAMERFAALWPGRVVEVLDVSEDMVAHGVALDRVRAQRHDGEHFCMIDPDIMAKAAFVPTFAELLEDHAVVSSGIEVWSRSNVVPPGHPGVAGEHFYTQDGFVFGGPHLTLYRRDVLDETASRWGVGLGSAGPELRDDTRAHLAAAGHEYVVYDTGKIVNALVQADGHTLVHRDLPQLLHVGGMSHFLSPSGYVDKDGERRPEWARYEIAEVRFQVNRFVARTLQAAIAGEPGPPVPPGLEPEVVARLGPLVRDLGDLVARYEGRC